MKTCISCGMPMTTPEEFPLGDMTKDYCAHCARQDGSMQSYSERLENFSAFLVRTQGFDQTASRDTARRLMADFPAWQDTEGVADERAH